MALREMRETLEEDTQKDKYLTFALDDEQYAIEIQFVTEIIGLQPISAVPNMPSYVKGVMNLRGQIIPVMDVRLRFRKPELAYNDRTCVIVVEVDALSVGLVVDRVSEVTVIPDSDIVPLPEVGADGDRFIQGIGKTGEEIRLVLDAATLIQD